MSTVSRVLSQSPLTGSLTPTAARIRKVAKELGYEADRAAASLRSGRTRTIGVVMTKLRDVVVSTVYETVERAISASGFQTLLVGADDEVGAQQQKAELLLGRRVDGLLLGASRLDDAYLDALRRREIPYVLVLRRSGDHPSVTVDDEAGGHLAGRHLIERGHRRVGVVAGPKHASTSHDRARGFTRAFTEAGISLDGRYTRETGFTVEAGYEAAQALLRLPDPPTAIFAMSDYAAMGVIGAYRDNGLEVGRDFALVGYHDIAISAQLSIPLTSVRSPLDDLGDRATKLFLDRMAGDEVESIRLPPVLQVRASSMNSWNPESMGPTSCTGVSP